jgi:signal transduction histidine kinase
MKYGSGNPIDIYLDRRGDQVLLRVQDKGIGISAENIQRIFNRFEGAVPITSYGGLGLGLYITRQIVEYHGGKIWVESQVGSGSTFFVELPIRQMPQNVHMSGNLKAS